ncbi:hypothetical protein [Noviherbaspirillum aerium]|uniref:hypothetical protein n=1 Tax=Noviherbaspirillum aerium TaxID=2588497 RepID=UPI00124E1BF8|nr:hypothetical protein [Noviherbaspirillum aerium]
MPKLAAVIFLLMLVALASTSTYAGYLVVGVLAEYLDIGRVAAGLLLGVIFARLPWVRQGKLRTVGMLPGKARLPVIVALLSFCLLHFLYRGEMVPVVFLGLAASFLLSYRWMRRTIVAHAFTSFFRTFQGPDRPGGADNKVIDVEFREKKD